MDTNYIVSKNRRDWDSYSAEYMSRSHSAERLRALADAPQSAFDGAVWRQLTAAFPDFNGIKVCVPSSGDNIAVYAFALLGAEVVSCDFSENQLSAARKTAENLGIADRIRFVRSDTMRLDEIGDGAFDLVYTSNGVHVWLNDLGAMYGNIFRIMRRGGVYIMYDVHPFRRIYGEDMNVVKPYDSTGPFEDEYNVNFHWRVCDIFNAIAASGIRVYHMEEIMSRGENGDGSALPAFICMAGEKHAQ